MQSFKTGPRADARFKPRKGSADRVQPRMGHAVEPAHASNVAPLEGAARIANLKLLLSTVNGDQAMLAAAVQLQLQGLIQMLEGHRVVGSEVATHIEETLALPQGWLDRKHVMADISKKTLDILHGRDISDFEQEIRNEELKGQEIMKNAAKTPQQDKSPTKAKNEFLEVRLANLALLTQARGAKSKLARALNVSESIISFLFSKKKEFNDNFTRQLESTLGLAENWFDTAHVESDIPAETQAILAGSATKAPKASKSPPPAPRKQEQPQAQLPGLKLNLSTGPTELDMPRESGESLSTQVQAAHSPTVKPHIGAKNSEASPGAGALTLRLNTPEAQPESLPPLDEETTPAPKTAMRRAPAPVAETAPQAVQASRAKSTSSAATSPQQPASVAAQPAAQAPASPTSMVAPMPVAAVAPSVESAPDILQLSPIAEALIKTLTMKAREGRLDEGKALELLQTVAHI